MTNTAMQLAKRELHDFFGNRTAWISAVAAGLVIGLAGPFGTDEVMRLAPRLAYWVCIAVMTYLTGSIAERLIRHWTLNRGAPLWLHIGLCGVCTGVLITAEILCLNLILFGFRPSFAGATLLTANVIVVSLVITTAATLIGQDQDRAAPSSHARPRLLDRLPMEKRGDLVSLSAVDHYVEVTTTNGAELILMRFSDAMSEAAPTPGLQTHRSHWVALTHISHVARSAGKAEVKLSDGRALPVSRANLPALKQAGLLAGGSDA